MITAREQGLTVCRTCHTLSDRPGDACLVCGKTNSYATMRSLQSVWAFWFAGLAAYIPGNALPIMLTHTPGGSSGSTIIGGVVELFHHGSYAIAGIIFLFSIVVPLSKFAVVAWISLSLRKGSPTDEHKKHRAHEIIEFLGKWSMIDVFVVAALAALIQLGGILRIEPGPATEFFALSVVFTMLAARCLDPRLIWSQNIE